MRALVRTGATAATLAWVAAACGGMATGDGSYHGPAGRVFPPDAEPLPPHERPSLPPGDSFSSGSPASAPAAVAAPQPPAAVGGAPPSDTPGTGAPASAATASAAPYGSAPAPAAPAPPPVSPASTAPAAAASRPQAAEPAVVSPPPAPAPGSHLTAAAPSTPDVIERPIYRAEGEKVGNDIDLRIERVWLENGFTFADLRVRNTSPYELEEITIKCTAFGKGHVNLDFREQTLLTRAEGRMLPGFDKSLRIRLERAGFDVREMSCNAKGW